MKNWLLLLLILLFSAIDGVHPIGVDIDFSVDRRDWVDINDPLSKPGDPTLRLPHNPERTCDTHCKNDVARYVEENTRLRQAIESLKFAKENSVDVLLKHVLRQFLAKLDVDISEDKDVYKMAQVTLTSENMRLLRRYLSSTKLAEEFGLREDIRFALENFIVEADHRSESSLFSMLHLMVPYITLLNIIILPAALWIIIRSIFTVRQLMILVLITSFFVSCYFTYARKYQEVLAQRLERLEKKADGHCTPQGLLGEAYNVLLSYVRIKGKSECLQSYEDVLIEPILLVDPLQVVAEVLSNFFLSPLSVAGIHFNKFFNDFFINTPVHLAVVKAIFLVFLLFYLTGYRIRTWLATIEPAGEVPRLAVRHPAEVFASPNDVLALPQNEQETLPASHENVTHRRRMRNLSRRDDREESKSRVLFPDGPL